MPDAKAWSGGATAGLLSGEFAKFRLRLKRRRRLWRAYRSRHALSVVTDRTRAIRPGQILAFSTFRNEMGRLPAFLDHNRLLGVDHFLMVDNDSTDDCRSFLSDQPDVSLWHTDASYRESRFGADWLGWLQMHFGHRHWCLTVDADELLVYPHWDTRPLPEVCSWLEGQGALAMGALMLDLFPKDKLTAGTHFGDPLESLQWFDPSPYRARRHPRYGALQVQGGARERMFFAQAPELSPTLNKLPLVKWNRRHVYTNSTHAMLPPWCNGAYDGPGDLRTSGVLLHTKFLPGIVDRSSEEKARRQHFSDPAKYDTYYDGIVGRPVMWHDGAVRYVDWRQLEALGLMSSGGWR